MLFLISRKVLTTCFLGSNQAWNFHILNLLFNLSLTYICALIEFESSLSYDSWIYFASYYSNYIWVASIRFHVRLNLNFLIYVYKSEPGLSEIRASVYIPTSLLSFIKYRDTITKRKKNNVLSSVTCDATVLLVSPRGVKSQSHGLKYHYYARSRYYRGPAIDRPTAKRMRLSRLKITRDTRYPWTLF